jgi:spermidine/putrescine transport system substrate-binding protein
MNRTSARMNRRDLLGLGALALGAAACGGSTGGGGGATASSQSLSGKKIEGTLKFYNWAQYVNPENTKAYEAQTGVHFDESNFTSNEQLLTKLQTTKGQKTYDIIVPDADHVRIEKDLGLLMKLDHSLIPNLKNLAPHWTQLPYDPGNVYSVVKDTGITCFTKRADTVTADLRTWKDFFDFLPHSGDLTVNFIESPSEVIGVALNSLGYSMNTDDEGQLNQVRDLLLKVKPYVDTVNEVYVNDFQAGKIDLGITYSGDGLRIQSARKKEGDIDVIAPEGKSEIWTDNWAISAYAPDPVAAHKWIDFILEPAVNAKEMDYVAYEVGTPASYPLVGELAKNPLVVFPDRILNEYEILETTPERQNTRQEIWNAFKAA